MPLRNGLVLACVFLLGMVGMKETVSLAGGLHPQVGEYVTERIAEFDQIDAERRGELEALAGYVLDRRKADKPVSLTFVCTHNSRRSHLAQLWTAVAAVQYGVEGIHTYSGGTEATAMNPRTVDALRRAGMTIATDDTAPLLATDFNPRYRVRFGPKETDQTCFSKIYDRDPNPASEFAAVMTCSHADENCPVVRGSDFRIAVRYEDPKVADGTPEEAAAYDERSRQIAREMLYMMSHVARHRE